MIKFANILQGKEYFTDTSDMLTSNDFAGAVNFLRENLDELTDNQKIRILEIIEVGLKYGSLIDRLDSNYFLSKTLGIKEEDAQFYQQLVSTVNDKGLTINSYFDLSDWCKKNINSVVEYELRVFEEVFGFKVKIELDKDSTQFRTCCTCYNKILDELM